MSISTTCKSHDPPSTSIPEPPTQGPDRPAPGWDPSLVLSTSQITPQLSTQPSDPPSSLVQLLQFLRDELAISEAAIKIALKCCQREVGPLPMILWQYGLISLDQLRQIIDWRAGSAMINARS